MSKPMRKLDAEVAREVMGMVKCQNRTHSREEYEADCWADAAEPDMGGSLPAFSTDIADAWKVVERLNQMGFRLIMTQDWHGNFWIELFQKSRRVDLDLQPWLKSAPEAICRAALEAVRARTPPVQEGRER